MADANKPHLPPANQQEEDVAERRTLRDYYIILRERLWIALPLALLLSIAYGYNKMKVEPVYQASATMRFDKPDTVVTTRGVSDPGVNSDVELNTKIKELESRMLRDRVKASFKDPAEQEILRRTSLRRAPPGTPPNSVDLDLGNIAIASYRASLLIEIRVQHGEAEAAALVANRYVQEFMTYLFEEASGKNSSAIKYLVEQETRLRAEADDSERKLQEYRRANKLLTGGGSEAISKEAVMRANSLFEETRLRILALESKLQQIETYQAGNRDIFEIPEIANNPAVSSARGQLTAVQQEIKLLGETYLERHPKMENAVSRQVIFEGDLQRGIAAAISEMRAQLDKARKDLADYSRELEKSEKQSLQVGDINIEYSMLERASHAAGAQHREVVNRIAELTTSKNVEKVPIYPLDSAAFGYQIAPNRNDIIRTSAGIFVLVFLGVAIGLSFIDDRVKSAWDVESFIGANLLGIVPDLAGSKDDEKYTLLLDNKQSPGVEAFLSVYSSVKIHSKLDFPKSILVTSTIPGEGKTLISCNVAGAFARHGKRTLLIDCDLRRPMLHRHFKQQNNAGLLSWFEGGGNLEGDLATNPSLGIIRVSENLSLLCSGGRSKSPTELLENPLFGQLLERLKREYDLIIVDSPPLGAVTDSLLIAERIDEVVYVCRFNRAYRKHIRLYMRALRNGKNEILGIVLNGLSPRRIEYYSNYRYYRSYKKYYGAQT